MWKMNAYGNFQKCNKKDIFDQKHKGIYFLKKKFAC